jgi:rubrerythrin
MASTRNISMATTLKFMPSAVSSPEQLLSLACTLEKEAARRYLDLAARMRLRNEGRLAALFDFLASIEEKHAAAVIQRAEGIVGTTPLTEVPTRQVPENFDAEAGESSLLTPYRALAIAVRNETRAFTFYSYLAATAPNDSVRKIAEGLAKEELGHADLLRRERRKAYREQKAAAGRAPAQLPQTLSELWSLCLDTEVGASRYHRELAELLRSQNDAAAAAFSAAAEDEESCARQAIECIGKGFPEVTDAASPTIRGGQRLLEEAFERYSDIAARSKEEEVMSQALSLAERASRRLFLASLALADSAN